MKKQNPPKEIFPNGKKLIDKPEVENPDQLKLRLLKGPEDKVYEVLSDKRLDDAKLKIELLNGNYTSLFEKWNEQKKILSEIRILYKPRFTTFLDLCSDLENFTDKQRAAFHKPSIVPKTIVGVIYSRYPREARKHLNKKNPLGKGFLRPTKQYYFFGEGGILILEKFIYEAEELMREVKENGLGGIYEFRVLHSQKYGTGYQVELFRKYIDLI